MSEAVEFDLADGTTVLVSPSPRAGSSPVGVGEQVARAHRTLRQTLGPVTSAAAEVIAEFRSRALHPEEIEVSFGVTLDVELGAIISSAKAGAHLDVRLRWRGERPAPAAPSGSGP